MTDTRSGANCDHWAYALERLFTAPQQTKTTKKRTLDIDDAKAGGWQLINMKTDWKTVFSGN